MLGIKIFAFPLIGLELKTCKYVQLSFQTLVNWCSTTMEKSENIYCKNVNTTLKIAYKTKTCSRSNAIFISRLELLYFKDKYRVTSSIDFILLYFIQVPQRPTQSFPLRLFTGFNRCFRVWSVQWFCKMVKWSLSRSHTKVHFFSLSLSANGTDKIHG